MGIQMNPTTINRIIMLLGASGVVLLSIFLYRQAVNKTEVKIDLGPLGQPGVVTVFRQVNRVSGLPMSVVREFHDDLANPNENFQKTDVVRGKGLKMRRLVFAALSRDYCIVYFEHGGIATTFYIVLCCFVRLKILHLLSGYLAALAGSRIFGN
jgi:hypothetical protein